MFELNIRAVFGAFLLCSLIMALNFGKIPFDSALKFILDVGKHGGWVSIDHVITIEALSMGDPYLSQGDALHEQPPPRWGFGAAFCHEAQHA